VGEVLDFFLARFNCSTKKYFDTNAKSPMTPVVSDIIVGQKVFPLIMQDDHLRDEYNPNPQVGGGWVGKRKNVLRCLRTVQLPAITVAGNQH
jgi:hypothetical protein